MIRGVPGIGKTTIWNQGVAAARDGGSVVLVAQPTMAEADVSFAGLSDLLESFTRLLGRLPRAQARALRVALALADSSTPPEARVIAAATTWSCA